MAKLGVEKPENFEGVLDGSLKIGKGHSGPHRTLILPACNLVKSPRARCTCLAVRPDKPITQTESVKARPYDYVLVSAHVDVAQW